MSVLIPAELSERTGDADWQDWLARLPSMINQLLADWSLTPDGASMSGSVSCVLPVRTDSGTAAVLKIGYPHPEAELEHLALRCWDGRGAVRLLSADPHRWALLTERAETGRTLQGIPVGSACEVIADLYPQLHRPAPPQFGRLSVLAAEWAERLGSLHDHPAVPRRLVDHAGSLARDFAADPQTDGTLIHTDLHFDNVLGSARGDHGWLAIDPKPLSGDPAFEIAPLLWNRWDDAAATGDLRTAVLDRVFTVVDRTGLDEDRVRDWVIVRELVNVLWSLVDSGDSPDSGWVTTAIVIAKAAQR